MRTTASDESPTRQQAPAGTAPAYDAPAYRAPTYDAPPYESVRHQRRRALATLDAADIVWRLIRIAVYTISAIIALAIVFHVFNANRGNSFVSTIDQWGHSLAGPFAGMFILHSAKATIGLDYGIAIVVYIGVAELLINLIDAAIVPARRRAASAVSTDVAGPDPRFPPQPRYPQYQ